MKSGNSGNSGNSGTESIRESYDDFPYYSFPYMQSAPENLAAVAHLFGLDTPDVSTARVLELGCASGGNLIPFAVRNPHARATGVDLSEVQVGEGRERIEGLRLRNVTLRALDLTSITKAFGEFDYIVCHGLYSWVPENVRQAILRICRENLAPEGVAYVSYKTYPGWKAHEIVRDAMLLRAGADGDIKQRLGLGRGIIDFLHAHARPDSVLASAIRQDYATISQVDANYLAHDFLAPFNTPCYFAEFVRQAGAHGMTYLAEAEPRTMFAANFGDTIAGPLLAECGGNQVLLEQYLDFVGDRSFRATLLVHEARREQIRYRLDASRMRALHVSSSLECAEGEARLDDSPQPFRTPNGDVIVLERAAAKAAARVLTRAAPFTLRFGELRDAVRPALASTDGLDETLTGFIEALVAGGLARYRLTPVERSGAKPCASDAARRYPELLPDGQAPHTFNAWHDPVVLDAIGQLMLPYLDGKHTPEQLRSMLEQAMKQGLTGDANASGEPAAAEAKGALERLLHRLCV